MQKYIIFNGKIYYTRLKIALRFMINFMIQGKDALSVADDLDENVLNIVEEYIIEKEINNCCTGYIKTGNYVP